MSNRVSSKIRSSLKSRMSGSTATSEEGFFSLKGGKRDFRQRLIHFYNTYNPEALSTVDSTLEEWAGREEELLRTLYIKYNTSEAKREQEEDYQATVRGLKKIYREKILPLEQAYRFDQFFSPYLEDTDFDAKPMVLLIGQFSVGKTSFIKHMLGRDFPGGRIAPEQTTDRFVCVMKGNSDQIIPGNALVVAPDKPFHSLSKFGTSFLNRLEASQCSAKVLDEMMFVDTPGVLAGDKQRIGRNYDFTGVVEWFAERADRIVLLFDPHKLDVSDEFSTAIKALAGNEEKIRVVLNKSDSLSTQQLMRVYGALMWSLGKVIHTPEVPRVYLGSFGDQPLKKDHESIRLFESEHQDLISDLRSLPRSSAVRKVNELVKRARLAKVHAYIMSHLKTAMPAFFGKSKKQQKILDNLPYEFQKIAQRFRVPPGDFPNIERFKETVSDMDLSKFPALKDKMIHQLDSVLAKDIPELMRKMRHPMVSTVEELDAANPFSENPLSIVQMNEGQWRITQAEKTDADNIFYSADLKEGGLSGSVAKVVLETATGLSSDKLFQIWALSDVDGNNRLDADEFAVALYLANMCKRGEPLPDILPPDLVPPNKR